MVSIVNPSFTAMLTGWTTTGPVSVLASFGATVCHTLPFSAILLPLLFTDTATVEQNIPGFTIGQGYTLSFFANALNAPNIIDIQFGLLPGQVSIIKTTSSNPVASPAPAFIFGSNFASTNLDPTGPTAADYVMYTVSFLANVTAVDLIVRTYGIDVPPGNVLFIDDFLIVTPIICYAGESLVRTRNIETGEITDTPASDVKRDVHEVYDVKNEKFISVTYNAVSGITKRYMKLEKDCIGVGQPSEDFYVTSGHKIVIDGVEVKAGKIPQAKRHRTKPDKVYSICTEYRTPILINGLHVIADSYGDWLMKAQRRGIEWIGGEKI